MEKYTIGKIQPTRVNCFEVIIVADMNDGDYVTTREFYSEEQFDNYVIDELIELLGEHSNEYELPKFCCNCISIPFDGQETCHSLEKVEVNYYDNNGSVRPVEINSGYDLEGCVCEGEE